MMAIGTDRTESDAVRALRARVDRGRLPRHVAIIMDGNGRWAKSRGLPRVAGHRAGIRAVRAAVEEASELGVEVLTLYAFSTENWRRPPREVRALMKLLEEYLVKEMHLLEERDIRFRTIGRVADLPESVRELLGRAEERTRGHRGMHFVIALSYSGRSEIVDVARGLAEEAAAGRLDPGAIDERLVASRLQTAGLPDPDLLVRTSGEMRVSNFLLWQIAYAELWVSPVLWPDFRREHFLEAVLEYQARERRFGAVSDPPPGGAAAP